MSKKARDLLPPDGPTPKNPEDVRASDDPLEVEVEDRKIGIRRVSSLDFADKLTARARWRPAGNSRRFWRQIEADDPFKKRPKRPTDAPLDVYPAQRVQRVEGSMPKPQPEVAKAYPAGARSAPEAHAEAPHRPMREQPRRAHTAPEPVHTPEPRAAVPPSSVVPEPEPAAPRPPAHQPRRLPPKPENSGGSRTGRQRMPSKGSRRANEVVGQGGRTASEIRAEKMAAREALKEKDEHPLEQKSLDTYRDMMANLLFSQEAYEAGEELPEMIDTTSEVKRPAKIKGEVKRKSKRAPKATPAAASQAPAPAPPPKPKPIDRTPPKPKSTATPKKDAPVDRSSNSGGLNDLFGGGGDRVRIGRRAKPTTPPEDDDS